MSVFKKKLVLKNSDEVVTILGEHEKNLPELEKKFDVNIYYLQNPTTGKYELEIVGKKKKVEIAFKKLVELSKHNVDRVRIKGLENRQVEIKPQTDKKVVYTTHTGKQIVPLSKNQKTYIDYINSYDIVVAIGPAGTGKTFLAVAEALNALETGKASRIVLTRPVVEAGEKLGFLPGDLYEKINPYLKPLYDAFYTMLGPDKFRRYREDETIEIIPLAYMRGRTIEDAFIILDEAQNTVPEQMKMFLTRLGINSQVVITGDITQIDLEDKSLSGLVLSEKILAGIPGIKFIHFAEEDVVRHKLVKEIIRAYEKWEKRGAGRNA
ncbi:MAG: PhoH family protein [Elusimicrobiota bacterium]|nr:PhoH family protein [Elusimicrobiota bacterium]